MIIELPNILDQDTCEEVIEYFEQHPELLRKGDVQKRFDGCTMTTDQIYGPLLKKIAALTNRLIIKAAKFYNIEELYLDYQSIAKWEAGKVWTSMQTTRRKSVSPINTVTGVTTVQSFT